MPSMLKQQVRFSFIAMMLGLLIGTAGCVYRIDIQQGNFLEDKDIERVSIGMTRVQVRSLLGTPMVADPFKSSRWDYVYYLKQGRLQEPVKRHFIVFFEDDKVTRVDRSGAAADKQPA
jgi:outer membrane protein assembly factor BamE